MGFLIQRFILGFGGITRWLFCQILNIPLNDKFSKEISFYIDEDFTKDRGGLTTENKNYISFFIFLFLFIIFIEKYNK
jgi:hypothetical protein